MENAPVREIVVRHWLAGIYEIYVKREDGSDTYCGGANVDVARTRAKHLAAIHKVAVREVDDA